MKRWFMGLAMVISLAGCGGGGGDAGTSVFSGSGSGGGAGGGSGSGGGAGSTGTTYSMTVDIQRNGAAITNNEISSNETVQAVATVKTSTGEGVQGVVVSFSEEGAALLSFAPTAGTALTDGTGKASIDISAKTAADVGATTVKAAAAPGSTAVTATKSVSIKAGSATGTAPAPAAMNFVGVNPSTSAIVIKGAGGAGRAESAILTFRVVDSGNSPINEAKVNFTMNGSSGGATLQASSGLSNSNGEVTVTVSSGTQPASIVVTASADQAAGVSAQSDTLIVSNSVPMAGGFEIVAEKYNLNGDFTGDTTKISAFVRDSFGNPVPDGVAVSFQTDFGSVGSSTLGGCTTVNGTCNVTFRVQDPRPTNGIATVLGTVRVGTDQVLSENLNINMATGPYFAFVIDENGELAAQQRLEMGALCKKPFELLLSDANGHAPAAGTVITSSFVSVADGKASVTSGSPVLDQLSAGFPPVAFTIEVDLSTSSACVANGAGTGSGYIKLQYKTPSNIVYEQRIALIHPR